MRPAFGTVSEYDTSSVPVLVFVNAALNASGLPPVPLARTVPLLVSAPAVRLNVVAPKLVPLCVSSISPALVNPFATVSVAPLIMLANWIVPVPVFVSAPVIVEAVPFGIVSVPLLLNAPLSVTFVNVTAAPTGLLIARLELIVAFVRASPLPPFVSVAPLTLLEVSVGVPLRFSANPPPGNVALLTTSSVFVPLNASVRVPLPVIVVPLPIFVVPPVTVSV